MNLLEYVVHHEDIRRAGPRPAGPRVLLIEEEYAIWRRLTTQARFAYRRSPVGVVLAVPGGERRTVKKGPDPIAISGRPVDLALHAFGRADAADVTITGGSND